MIKVFPWALARAWKVGRTNLWHDVKKYFLILTIFNEWNRESDVQDVIIFGVLWKLHAHCLAAALACCVTQKLRSYRLTWLIRGEFLGSYFLQLHQLSSDFRRDKMDTHSKSFADSQHINIRVDLQEKDLWSKFHGKINEMIVTKNGRRMFPVIKVNISGLEPNTFYSILLEFKQIEKNRWKYINGDWLAGKKKHWIIFLKSKWIVFWLEIEFFL